MHVYHYAGYETGAIKRLMQRHGTRVDEVDRLLRGGTFVDLYNVVRQGVRASVESYSIKRIEKFYLPKRSGPVTEAGFSVVAYETWLRDGDEEHLRDLADYNRDDCISTWMLRDWLEERRREAIDHGWPMDRPPVEDGLPGDRQTAQGAETARRVEALTSDVPADRTSATDDQRNRWLLAQLLDWHGRDAKPEWWNFYRLNELGVDDLIDTSEGLGGLVFEADIRVARTGRLRAPLSVPAAGPPDPRRTKCHRARRAPWARRRRGRRHRRHRGDDRSPPDRLEAGPPSGGPDPGQADRDGRPPGRAAPDRRRRARAGVQRRPTAIAGSRPRGTSWRGRRRGSRAVGASRAASRWSGPASHPWMPRSGSGSISTMACFRSRARPAAGRPGPGPG